MSALPKYLRFNDLREMGIVNNWTTLCRWIKQGHFPQGRMIGPNSRAWTDAEVEEWQQRIAADTTTERPSLLTGRSHQQDEPPQAVIA